MPQLKRCSNLKLKAQPKFNPDTGQFDLVVLAGDCDDCYIFPDGALPGGMVWTGETDTVTLHAQGYIPRYTTTTTVGGVHYTTTIEADCGIANAKVEFFWPTVLLPYHRATFTITINGSLVKQETINLGTDPTLYFPLSWSIDMEFPVRLFADIRELGRYPYGGSVPWGPTGQGYGDDETVDLRGYKNAVMDWYYWPNDGAATVEVSAYNETITATDEVLTPLIVSDGYAKQYNFDFTAENNPGWIECNYWNNAVVPDMDRTIWHDSDPATYRGVKSWVTNGRLCMAPRGENSDARCAHLALSDLQPPRTITLTGYVTNYVNQNYSDGVFNAVPLDGPDQTGNPSYYRTDVNTEYPVDDTGTTGEQGQAVEWSLPGEWTGTGEAWRVYATCWLDIFSGVNVLIENKNTIGDPAFGFVFNTSELMLHGQEKNAWRLPLMVPSPYNPWNSLKFIQKTYYLFDDLDMVEWQGLSGTKTYTGSGTVHVYGEASPLKIRKHYTGEDGIGTVRYLAVPVRAVSGSVSCKLIIGSKEWSFTANTSGDESIIDLLAPDTATAPADDTSKREIYLGTGQGDWAWGIEPEFTMELQFSGEVYLSRIYARNRSTPGFLGISESIYRGDERFFWQEVEDGLSSYREYLRRMLLYAPEGRIAYDIEGGIIRLEGGDIGEDIVQQTYSISDMVLLASQREPNGLSHIIELKPSRMNVSTAYAGTWLYFNPWDFFNNQVESYHLTPTYQTFYGNQRVYATGSYGVDRIEPGIGVSVNLVCRKSLGGAIHGIILGSDRTPKLVSVALDPGTQSTTSTDNGLYRFPSSGNLSVNSQLYSISTVSGLIGSPATDGIQQGISTRLSAVEE